jgi:hypothetical protein
MAQNLANYDAVLKEFYEGSIRETINNEVVAFKILDETDKEWSGRRVLFPVHTGRNSGVGARGEATDLPTAGNQGYQNSITTSTYQYGRIRVTGPVMKAGKNAFAATVASEIEGTTRDLINDLGRQTWGYGDGRLAQVGAAVASASTVTVYNRFFEPGQNGARYIHQNQLIDIGTVASPASLTSSATVQSISVSSNPATTVDSITVDLSSTVASQCESFLFNRGAGGSGIEMMGLQGLVDVYTESNIFGSNAFAGSAVQSINRASVSKWNSLVLGNSGTARIIDGYLMQTAFDRLDEEGGIEDPDFIWGHQSVLRAFLDSVSSDRRYGAPTFDAGMKSLSYNGVALIKDRQATYNQLCIGHRSALSIATLADFEWADDDGSILSRVADRDEFEAFIRAYKNLMLEIPNRVLMIRDIKTDL